jgi:hypothetical protein
MERRTLRLVIPSIIILLILACNFPTAQRIAAPTLALAPPTVIDSLVASAGGGPVTDEKGVSLTMPPDSLENGQQAQLERASLSPSMQSEIEKAYQIDSLVYAIKLQDGQDGIGRAELSLPAPSPEARLAVLIDDRWLGVLETPAEGGVFRLTPSTALASGVQTFPDSGGAAEQAPNRYLVLTPKAASSQAPQGGGKMAIRLEQTEEDGKSCVAEFWIANHCWRNAESSVYVFWESDVPANLKDQEYLRVIDTIKAVAAMMSSYQQKGFTAAAISPSNPAYVIIEAGASEPYYSFKTGNVYIPWDVIGGIGDTKNRCTLGHEFFHWIEDEEYRMGVAALSGPKAWWLETSAENGSFLLDPSCIDKNLTQYGLVNTNGNVLGFQAAALQWEFSEQARYIQALQLYLSICDGGANCAMSQESWTQAINSGNYPMEGGALTVYENNAKDLGRFLLGAAPVESRSSADIPPSARSGTGFGDYLALKTSPRGIWDYGLTMNQFTKASEQQVKVEAKIAKGGVYPLWVSNGAGTPMGTGGGNTGLPGLLEIQAGPAFWLKQDQAEPVFYPAGKSLKLGPISDKLGVGAARIVAVAPDGDQTFQANLSLADLSGDWMAQPGKAVITPIDCPGYKASDDESLSKNPDDMILQYFSAYGTYVVDSKDPQKVNQIWQGTLPEDFTKLSITATSEVTVSPDKVVLHYHLDIPKPTTAFNIAPWLKPEEKMASVPVPRRRVLLSGLLFLPMSAGIVWMHSKRRKWARLATVLLLVLAAVWLSSCLGSCDFKIWGTMDGTYTFKKLEYIDPLQAAAKGAGEAGSQPAIIWKLGNGEVVEAWDLTLSSTNTDDKGVKTEQVSPCKLTINGNAAKGTIGPSDSVTLPDKGK